MTKGIRTKWMGMLVLACGLASQSSAVSYGNGVRKYSTGSILSPTTYSKTFNVSTKTSAAIQTAINSANAAGGGTVVLESGTYWCDSTLTPKSNVKIIGAGPYSTILKRKSSWGDGSFFYAVNQAVQNFQIHDLQIHGNYTTSDLIGKSKVGVQIGAGGDASLFNRKIMLKNVRIVRCSLAVVGGGMSHFRVQYCDFYQNGNSGLNHNMYLRRIGYMYLYKTDITYSVEGTGFKAYGASYQTPEISKNMLINYCSISHNYKNNAELPGFHNSYYHHNNFDSQKITLNNYNAGILLGQTIGVGCTSMDVINNIVESNAKYGIRIDSPNGLNVQGNRCRYNGVGNYEIVDSGTGLYCDYNND